jgi:Domain of unknown function (DUF5011)
MNTKSILTFLLLSGIFMSWQACKSEDDTDLPYILLEGDNPYYIDSIGGTFTEQGYKSVDDVDGDLTDQVLVSYPTILSDSARTYEAVYSVTDRSGNKFTTKRFIIVQNTNFYLAGFYPNCSQIRDTIIDSTFSAAVIPSLVVNNEFFISNFGNLGYGLNVVASINPLTGKIIINTPQLLADSSTLDFVNADSSYYSIVNDSIRFQVFYSHSKNGTSETNRTYYSK